MKHNIDQLGLRDMYEWVFYGVKREPWEHCPDICHEWGYCCHTDDCKAQEPDEGDWHAIW